MCSSNTISEKPIKLCVDTSHNDEIKRSQRASYLSCKALLSSNPILSDSALLLLKSTRAVTNSVQAPRGLNAMSCGRYMVPTHTDRDETDEISISRDEKIILLRRLYQSGQRKRRPTFQSQNIEKRHRSKHPDDSQLQLTIGNQDVNIFDMHLANSSKSEIMSANAFSTTIRELPRQSSDSSGSDKSIRKVAARSA